MADLDDGPGSDELSPAPWEQGADDQPDTIPEPRPPHVAPPGDDERADDGPIDDPPAAA